MKLDPKKTPEIPLHLLEWLEGLYPHRSRQRGETNEDSLFMGGRRAVVDMLRYVYDKQNNMKE